MQHAVLSKTVSNVVVARGRFSSLHRRASGTESGGGWGRGTLQADKQTELLAIMMSVCDCRMGSEVAIEEIGDAELCH